MLPPPIENWEQLSGVACLLLLLVFANIAVVYAAVLLRRRIMRIAGDDTAPASSHETAEQPDAPDN